MDLIVSGGENVWPEQVEAVLRGDPLIADVVVAGVDDPEWGQRVVAWVVPSSDHAPTLIHLRDLVRDALPAYMAPKELRLIAEIRDIERCDDGIRPGSSGVLKPRARWCVQGH